ncbi:MULTISPECIES: toll/interleukin-1 receptor domain-containing protein [unclassified Streptomyces]|uniref:toll/interleukin-1 receptor domain-containing protein n=1 Tax=unclassified Streptomyces TaxID=2593676 RepID=UPI002DDBF817|nr:toll/interleukin-1 receptor domain-containing protein [Streptomyces sp. NBC_01294]WRZ61008.1 toll/interleukin-1 receptor domain-containing protein [Streptomyces sp. NBC_01294]
MAPSIFINFRRADTDRIGAHLDTALQNAFGKDEVFRDQRSIAKGAHFPDEIKRNLRKCDILLAVMGKQWASLTDATGSRYLDHKGDWVRTEIALALKWGLVVLPVLVDGAELPEESELSHDIRALTTRQAIPFRPHHEEIDLPPLIQAIRKAVPTLRPARPDDSGTGNQGAVTGNRFDHSAVVINGRGNTARNYNLTSDPEDETENQGRP